MNNDGGNPNDIDRAVCPAWAWPLLCREVISFKIKLKVGSNDSTEGPKTADMIVACFATPVFLPQTLEATIDTLA